MVSAALCRVGATCRAQAAAPRAAARNSAAQPVAAPRLANAFDHVKSLAAATVIAASLAAGPAFAGSVALDVPKTDSGAVHAVFSVQGMDVLPAAEGLIEGTGHFHLLVDEKKGFVEGQSIPFDDTHLHYGKGQTEADVTLAPGKHLLTLQFANALHQSYGPEYATSVEVTIK